MSALVISRRGAILAERAIGRDESIVVRVGEGSRSTATVVLVGMFVIIIGLPILWLVKRGV